MERAYALSEVKRWADAIPLVQQALATEPEHYAALCLLGDCFEKLGRAGESLAIYERAIVVAPQEETAFSLLACALSNKYRKTKPVRIPERRRLSRRAIAMAETAINLAPESPRALAAMSTVLFAVASPAKAIPFIERHLRAQPSEHYAYGNMAYALYSMGRYAEAESFARRALEINPQSVNTIVNLSAVLINKERYREAIKILEYALVIDPQHEAAKFNLSLAVKTLLKKGRSADLPDGAQKSSRRQLAEYLLVIGVASCVFLLAAFLQSFFPTLDYRQSLIVCFVTFLLPAAIIHNRWQRREFKRLSKGTQMLLEKERKGSHPWFP